MKKILLLTLCLLPLSFSQGQFTDFVNIRDHNTDGTGELTAQQCNGAYQEVLYYQGTNGPRIVDTFTADSSVHWRFNQQSDNPDLSMSFIGEYDPNNLVEFGDFQWWSKGKPAGIDSVVAVGVDQNQFSISDGIPDGYERRDVAAQLVFNIQRYAHTPNNNGIPVDLRYVENIIPYPAQVVDQVPPQWRILLNADDEDSDFECVNIHLGRCGDGVIDGTNGGVSMINNGGEITGQNPGDFGLMSNAFEPYEECDPAHPDFDETTCDPVTCEIMEPPLVCQEVIPNVEVTETCGDGVMTITLPQFEGRYFMEVVHTVFTGGDDVVYSEEVTSGQIITIEGLEPRDYTVELRTLDEGFPNDCLRFFEPFGVGTHNITIDNISSGGPVCDENTFFSFDVFGILEPVVGSTIRVSYSSNPNGPFDQSFDRVTQIDDINADGSVAIVSSPPNLLSPGIRRYFTVEVLGVDECVTTGEVFVSSDCCVPLPISLVAEPNPLQCTDESSSITVTVSGLSNNSFNPVTIYYSQDPSLPANQRQSVSAEGGATITQVLNDIGAGTRTVRVVEGFGLVGEGFPECFSEETIVIEREAFDFEVVSEDPEICSEEGIVRVSGLENTETYTISLLQDGVVIQGPTTVSALETFEFTGVTPGNYEVTVTQEGSPLCVATKLVVVDSSSCVCGDPGFENSDGFDPLTMCNGPFEDGCTIEDGEISCQYCRSDCVIVTQDPDPICGDGVVNQDIEECDDGDQTNDDTCTNDCALTVCGDGMIQDPNSDNQIETCDDGNTTDGDGCSSSCIIEVDNPVCGDGIVNQDTEECEVGVDGYTDETCVLCQIQTPPVCGSSDQGFLYVSEVAGTSVFENFFTEQSLSPTEFCETGTLVPGSISFETDETMQPTNYFWTWSCISDGIELPVGDECKITALYCGDGNQTTNGTGNFPGANESCDDGAENTNISPDLLYTPDQQDPPRTFCNESCVEVEIEDPFCGDTLYDDPALVDGSVEQCDGTDLGVCTAGQSCSSCGCTDDPVDGECSGVMQMVYDLDNTGDYFVDNSVANINPCSNGLFSGGSLMYILNDHQWTYVCEGQNGGGNSPECRIQEKRCGDDIPNGGEVCDDGEDNIEYDPANPPIVMNGQAITFCTTSCEEITIVGGTCGDGEINGDEVCDDGTGVGGNTTIPPTVGYGEPEVQYCTTQCVEETATGPSCGDGILQDQFEACDNGEFNDGVTQVTVDGEVVVCTNECKVVVEEISCERLTISDSIVYPNDFDYYYAIEYSCEAQGTDIYRVVLKNEQGEMIFSNTAAGVFSGDFVNENESYWLECLVGPDEVSSNSCRKDIHNFPPNPICDDLTSTLTIDEVPGQIDFSCTGIFGDYTVELINDTTQELLEVRTGPEGASFTGSFEGLGEGEYRVECRLGDQVNTQVGCFERHTIDEDPVVVPVSCEQLIIPTGNSYTSLPAVIDYNCWGQPFPIDTDAFEVRVLDTNGNPITVTDAEGNTVSVLTDQAGSFVIDQEGDFVVSCEYQGEGAEGNECKVPIHIDEPQIVSVCEELLIGEDRLELGASVDLTCTGTGELFEIIVTNQQGQDVFSESSNQSFTTSFVPQNSGIYDVVCLVDGNTNQACNDAYTQRVQEKVSHKIQGVQRDRLVPTQLATVQPTILQTPYQKELREIEKKTAIETTRACEDTCKGKFVVEEKEVPSPTCEISELPDVVMILLGEESVRVTPLCTTTELENVSFTCSGGVRDGDSCVYDTPGLYAIQCTQDERPIVGCKDVVRVVIEEDPQSPSCEISEVPETAVIVLGEDTVSVTPLCTTTGLENVSFTCSGGVRDGDACVYNTPGLYAIQCIQEGSPIAGCEETVKITKENPPEGEKECVLRYTPEDKIIESTTHSVDVVCETQGFEQVGVLCGTTISSGSTATCDFSGEGSYRIGCTSSENMIVGCQDIITLKKPTESTFDFCGDGVVQTPNDDGQNEECDDGNTTPGDGCFACEIEETTGGGRGGGRRSSITSYCGDGVINVGEFCDAGGRNGTSASVCSEDCTIEVLPLPQPTPDQIRRQTVTGAPPKCSYIDPPSIQAGELLPFWWGTEEGVLDGNCTDIEDAGNIDVLTMYCGFERIAPDDTSYSFTRSCTTQDLKSMNRYEDFASQYQIGAVNGGMSVLDTSARQMRFDQYGEYRIQLTSIDYEVCQVEEIITTDSLGNQTVEYVAEFKEDRYEGRICQMNVAVTTPYYLNKGTSLTSNRDDKRVLDSFADAAGNLLTPRVESDLSLQVAQSDVFGRITTRTTQAIPLATDLVGGSVFGTDIGLFKSPASEIYVAKQDMTIIGSRVDSSRPRILIVQGEQTITIQGSLAANIMIVAPEGRILFQSISCDVRESVQGIYIANQIVGGSVLANTSTTTFDRCEGGGLTIEGLLVAKDPRGMIQLTKNRRSTLDNWFDGNTDITQKVFEGASLRVDTGAIKRTALPPLASDLLDTLQVIRQ